MPPLTRASSNAAPAAPVDIRELFDQELSTLDSEPNIQGLYDDMGTRQSEPIIDPIIPELISAAEHRRATTPRTSATEESATFDNHHEERHRSSNSGNQQGSTLENILG